MMRRSITVYDRTVYAKLKELPTHSLAALGRVAVKDAKSLDRTNYLPDYTEWHGHRPDLDVCEVCLAGAVLARSMGHIKETVKPHLLPDAFMRVLNALDHLRSGSFVFAYRNLQLHTYARCLENEEGVIAIPPLEWGEFMGWREFDLHISSLERVLDGLEVFEDSVDQLAGKRPS